MFTMDRNQTNKMGLGRPSKEIRMVEEIQSNAKKERISPKVGQSQRLNWECL